MSVAKGSSLSRLALSTAVLGLFATCSAAAATRGAPDSTSQPLVSVIVQAVPGAVSAAREVVRSDGGTVTHELHLIDGFTASIPAGKVRTLSVDPHIRHVTPNGAVQLASASYDAHHDDNSLYNLENMIGARGMWTHWTGAGIDVALIDSGVAPVSGLNADNKVVHGPDLTEESQNADTARLDTFGHGTQMAAIIAGHDDGVVPATNQGNAKPFLGVAPDARLVSVKVADARGMTDVTQVLAGIDWVVQHAHDPGLNVRVLNLSFGTKSQQSYLVDPLAYAAEQAWKHGIVVVTSAGNGGSSGGRLTNPAIDPQVIAVAADDMNGSPSVTDDRVPGFSSHGDGVRNPDLLAPGAHVQSLRIPGSYVDQTYSSTGRIDSRYFRGSGTSQAAAVVSGAAALLLQQHPDYSPDQIKKLLTSTALPLKGVSPTAQGAGLINLRAASGSVRVNDGQPFTPARGAGSLEEARGGANQTLHGITLVGEKDIFGRAVDTAALAAAEAAGSSWSGGEWNGAAWAGSSWSGSSWSSSRWTSQDWSGSSWSDDHWSSGTWTGSSWSNTTWSGSTWAGSSWSDSGLSDSGWSNDLWATASWS